MPKERVRKLEGKSEISSRAHSEPVKWGFVLRHGRATLIFRYNPGNETSTFKDLYNHILSLGFPELAIENLTIHNILGSTTLPYSQASTIKWVHLEFTKVALLGDKAIKRFFNRYNDAPMREVWKVVKAARSSVEQSPEAKKRLKRGVLVLRKVAPELLKDKLYDAVFMRQLKNPAMLLVKEIVREGNVVDYERL